MPFILDAPAVLAVVLDEPGEELVLEAMAAGAEMSSVNVEEVASRLYREGWNSMEIRTLFQELSILVLPFDFDAAILSGQYRPATQPFGLGLADRACLATGYLQACPVLTADRTWTQLDLQGIEVRCIR